MGSEGRINGPRMRRATVSLVAFLALALFAANPTAEGEGQIVVTGADSGSHLRLTVSDGAIVVNGYMAPGDPPGCRLTKPRSAAVCPLAGVGSVEVDMGPSADKVEVLDALPIPLTAHLGAGSDKLIGNGEPDTCYPEGTRRNRCTGGPGSDICITGPRNTDCVGGPGNDYCKASTGSDGCFGGPGRDVCLMGPGHDGCHGGPGDDLLYGGSWSDKLYGGRGEDRLYGGGAADKLYGGPGFDYCDGQGPIGRSYRCEAGPRH
jgi:Ca2+-binding RTX toxin-like protein